MKRTTNRKAFSLVELLVVVGIIMAVAITSFLYLKPDKRGRDARNARRVKDATTIADAIGLAIAANLESAHGTGQIGNLTYNSGYPGIIYYNLSTQENVNTNDYVGPIFKPPMTETQIGTANIGVCGSVQPPTGSGCTIDAGRACIDLANGTMGPSTLTNTSLTANGLSGYLKSNPIDPASRWDTTRTGYTIAIDANDVITIRNCNMETGGDPPNAYKPYSISR